MSEQSLSAARVALEIVEDAGHLSIVHVLHPMSPMDPGVVWGAWTDDSRRKHARETVRRQVGDDFADAQIEIRIGDASHEIADHASELGADLIVIPSHGRTGAKRFFIGSVAERVVRYAHCPVLVLRE